MASTYLSVITVNYNDAQGLMKTRDSILPLPENCQWIIIDGGSSDSSVQVLKDLPVSSHISWVSEPDNGIYDAMNKGMALARGDYLSFMNAGDCFIRSKFEDVCRQKPNHADIILYNCDAIRDDGKQASVRKFPQDINELKSWACVQHQSALFSRSVFSILGAYDTNYTYLADYAHSVRAFLNKDLCFSLHPDEKIARFNVGGVSTNPNTAKVVLKEYMEIQKKYFGTYSKRLYIAYKVKFILSKFTFGLKLHELLKEAFLSKR